MTVVFVDLVGSTTLSSQVDPERYREVLATYYRTVAEELESLRGRAVNLAGDAVVGVFGIPHAHDDDALRAVRAGLALVERVGRISEALELPVPLRVRVGINTGPVAIGSEASEQGLLFGATVNLAARVQQAAEPGGVLVAETSWLLTHDHVQYGEPLEVEAKGFERIAMAWPVVAIARRTSRRTIAFVNRRRELRLLADTFEGVRETLRGHLVTLLGEPGVGKSRVAEEFLNRLPEDATVLVGRASPFGEDVTFAPLAQMLLGMLGEEASAPDERLRERLKELAEDRCPADEAEATAARLGIALGLGSRSRDQGRYRVSELRSGFLALVAGIARGGPVVLVFEDAHLAEPSLLDLIEGLVRTAKGVPVMVLCVARYELLDQRPDWGGGLGDSLNLYLEPLSMDQATELALEAGEGLEATTAENVARHAGGNPFFIVETTGMLRHEGAELPSDTGPLPGSLLPPTVQAVIAARIDHLPPSARDLVRKASVFPRATFDTSDLAIIAEPDEEVLALLEDEELLVRDEQGPDVWRFRHGLVRDVAYESLPKRERQRLHLRVATKRGEDEQMAARYPRAIAYHLEQAAKAALDLNPRDRTLAERAIEALTHAGDLAMWALGGGTRRRPVRAGAGALGARARLGPVSGGRARQPGRVPVLARGVRGRGRASHPCPRDRRCRCQDPGARLAVPRRTSSSRSGATASARAGCSTRRSPRLASSGIRGRWHGPCWSRGGSRTGGARCTTRGRCSRRPSRSRGRTPRATRGPRRARSRCSRPWSPRPGTMRRA